MSIRDIIEATLVSSGNSEESWAEYYDCPDGIEASFPYIEQAEARFIATFDPEHVALMEAERVAAREFITDRAGGLGFAVAKYDRYIDACEATDAYRKERGL